MAGLTKSHFVEIASIINNCAFEKDSIYPEESFKKLVEKLANYFRTQNPLFNENRFKKACLE